MPGAEDEAARARGPDAGGRLRLPDAVERRPTEPFPSATAAAPLGREPAPGPRPAFRIALRLRRACRDAH